ncbi:mitochondrial import inner membrane translocase subunit TIM50-C [Nilaparvata lugens]|uniref:mitochondrial import inner membrane translocase subunit TIM50-C n=1 Tax=Nilaparvata lugens TaxID=108931 RepID=UPI00193CCFBA|nr:mitochondrial import inner membrane translocase subunit TIM50-C [Nilaparvata lugens]
MAGVRVYRLGYQFSRILLFKDLKCIRLKSPIYATNNYFKQEHSFASYRLPLNVCCRHYQAGRILQQLHTEIKNEQNKEEKMNEDEEEMARRRQEANRKTKYMLIAMGSFLGLLGGSLVFNLGAPRLDEDGNEVEDEFSSLPIVSQYLKRMLRELDYYNKMLKHPSRDKLLPDPLPYPYQQPPYTLVLELKDLLVHPEWTYQTGWRFKKRPGVDQFLEQVASPYFEVVIFTAEPGMTVFPIIDGLDPNGYITYRLVRDSTDFVDGQHVKNLDCLNRDLSKVIVVDWNPGSVKFHLDNTLVVPRWSGNMDDTYLNDLSAFLRTIAASEVGDVRDVIRHYQQFDNPIEAFREKQRLLMEQMEEQEKMKKQKPVPFTLWPGRITR